MSESMILHLERSRNSMDGGKHEAFLHEDIVSGWAVLRAGNRTRKDLSDPEIEGECIN